MVIGQIVFHEYSPEIFMEVEEGYGAIATTEYCDLDFDLINDIFFELKYWYSPASPSANEAFSCNVWPSSTILFAESTSGGPCNIRALLSGDTISDGINNWIDIGGTLYNDPENYISCSPFSSFKYVAFKINWDNLIHYGWLKLKTYFYLNGYDPGSYARFYLKEFAYNSLPNCGLIAGDTITSLVATGVRNNLTVDEFTHIYPNPVKDVLHIDNTSKFSKITLKDLYGSVVYNASDIGGLHLISCKTLNNGLYVLVLEKQNIIRTSLVIIAK
jgi:hypothetical protein